MEATASTHSYTVPIQRQESDSSFASRAGSNTQLSIAASSPPEGKPTPAGGSRARTTEYQANGMSGAVRGDNARSEYSTLTRELIVNKGEAASYTQRSVRQYQYLQSGPRKHNTPRRFLQPWRQRTPQRVSYAHTHAPSPPSLHSPTILSRPRSSSVSSTASTISNPWPEEWSTAAEGAFNLYRFAENVAGKHSQDCGCDLCRHVAMAVAKVGVNVVESGDPDGDSILRLEAGRGLIGWGI
ncbi:hypothetical protein BGZ60DRAFT_534681 [Tricladium varicosporioides]|nr:hypothetical protein BGZ60DRAFT_534681 [Hymenoscyphus varicosporioides]